jgi:hypothetical protein
VPVGPKRKEQKNYRQFYKGWERSDCMEEKVKPDVWFCGIGILGSTYSEIVY